MPIVVQAEGDAISLPIVRIGLDDVPILFANDFVIQHYQHEFILTIGQIQPPILLGTPEQQREQAQRLSYVPIKTVARIGLTRERLIELIQVLQTNLNKYDERESGGG